MFETDVAIIAADGSVRGTARVADVLAGQHQPKCPYPLRATHISDSPVGVSASGADLARNPVDAALRHQRPGDAGVSVGERDGDDKARLPCQHARKP